MSGTSEVRRCKTKTKRKLSAISISLLPFVPSFVSGQQLPCAILNSRFRTRSTSAYRRQECFLLRSIFLLEFHRRTFSTHANTARTFCGGIPDYPAAHRRRHFEKERRSAGELSRNRYRQPPEHRNALRAAVLLNYFRGTTSVSLVLR